MEAIFCNTASASLSLQAQKGLESSSKESGPFTNVKVDMTSAWAGQTSRLQIHSICAKKCRVQLRSIKMEASDGNGDIQGQGKVATGGAGGLGVGEDSDVKASVMLQSLQEQMREATEKEDYTEAARVRDLIRTLEDSDPVFQLRRSLANAIQDERYDDASHYRDELKRIAPPEPENPAMVTVNCTSDTVTQGVRVRVRSIYVRDRSTPSRQQYFFAYRIRISNEGSRAVQLLNRHWVITDANGRTEEVRGPGVIGEQPVLRPGGSFEYTSACPLRTPYGTMEGEYEMIHSDELVPSPFEVKVGPFALNVNNDEL